MLNSVLILGVLVIILYITMYCSKVEKFTLDSGIPGPNFLAIGTIHGNEPAASYALEQIVQDFKSGSLKLKKGSITIIPCLNKCGRILGIRFQPQELLKFHFNVLDGNRTYPKSGQEEGTSDLTKDIIPLVNFSDAVFDGHEGHSYVGLHSGSMGNGIFPGTTNLSRKVAKHAERVLNAKIHYPKSEEYKKYTTVTNWKTPDGTLRNYCNRKQIHYILMETAGQDEIEPLSKRIRAQRIVCLDFMSALGIL